MLTATCCVFAILATNGELLVTRSRLQCGGSRNYALPFRFKVWGSIVVSLLVTAVSLFVALRAPLEERATRQVFIRAADGAQLAETRTPLLRESGRTVSMKVALNGQPIVLEIVQKASTPLGALLLDLRSFWGVLLFCLSLVLVIGAAVWPIAVRLTNEIEQIAAALDRPGAEVPQLAPSSELHSLSLELGRAIQRAMTEERASRSLLANASHELRTPLTRIRMALELSDTDPQSQGRRVMLQGLADAEDSIQKLLRDAREALSQDDASRHSA